MIKRYAPMLLPLLALAALAACDRDTPASTAPAGTVVVYAGGASTQAATELLKRYREETGVNVIVREGGADDIVDDLVANKILPPADMLWVDDVAAAWRAAEEGALRPANSATAAAQLPASLRDPDDFWVAMSQRRALLVFDPEAIEPGAAADYAALADDRYRGRLCLSSSALPINRAVLAMLIDSLGERPTELAVRGWVANLARPVFAAEAQLLAAIGAGECAIGIASGTAVANAGADLATLAPTPASVAIEAVGIGRHAGNPAGARRLLDWLLQSGVQEDYAERAAVIAAVGGEPPLRNAGIAAVLADDARLLAERARYR